MKQYSIIVTIIAIITLVLFSILFFHGKYHTKILVKLGLKERVAETNWAIFSWESCLNQLDYDADIVFFGNSITRGGDFQNSFKGKKIVNLGYSGDTINGMTQRINMVKNVSPEKIFVMIGINDLNNYNFEICVKQYSTLLKTIHEAVPDSEIYVQSVLPVHGKKEKTCSNSTIEKFNKELEKLSAKYDMTYIDLFSVFIEKNEPKTMLYKDDVHINTKGYEIWAETIREYIE